MGVIYITDSQNQRHTLEAVEGWRVMEIIREHGFEAGGVCGGACACATCHVEVDEAWLDKLYPPTAEEEDMLDQVTIVGPRSRLSCQIIYSEELDGLSLRLAPG